MEGLKRLTAVVGELDVSHEALGVVCVWVCEVVFASVKGPLVD
jgi:hypothetical protein